MLSRGNRLCAGKGGTAVLDFCNTADAVRAAFGAFWGECVWRGSAAAACSARLRSRRPSFGGGTAAVTPAVATEARRESLRRGLIELF